MNIPDDLKKKNTFNPRKFGNDWSDNRISTLNTFRDIAGEISKSDLHTQQIQIATITNTKYSMKISSCHVQLNLIKNNRMLLIKGPLSLSNVTNTVA